MIKICWISMIMIAILSYSNGTYCGCKRTRKCYKEMVETLKSVDETVCVEDTSPTLGTMLIYFKALKEYCGEIISVLHGRKTYEGKYLYEIIIENGTTNKPDVNKPAILLEAGQEAGEESSDLALFVIQQLMACRENNDMLLKATWVILPSTNPDGQEAVKSRNIPQWKKNNRMLEDKWSFGVDISRNFDSQWGACDRNENPWSLTFPGTSSMSENETIFIKDTLNKYKTRLKAYVSIRRNGHGIFYPYSYTRNNPSPSSAAYTVAGNIAAKVNQRAVSVNIFVNSSIYDFNNKGVCGSSVDLAHDMDIPLSYEMRVFFKSDMKIMSEFQPMPRGYETSLRAGYFAGIRELYSAVVNENKYANGGKYYI